MKQLNARARSIFTTKKSRVLVTITAVLIMAIALYTTAFAATPVREQTNPESTSNRFLLELGSGSGRITSYFSESERFGEKIQVVITNTQAREDIIKSPGLVNFADLVLVREATQNMDYAAWLKTSEGSADFKKSGTLTMFDKNNVVIGKWTISNAWPCGIEFEQDKNDSDKYNEIISFAIDRIDRVSIGPKK